MCSSTALVSRSQINVLTLKPPVGINGIFNARKISLLTTESFPDLCGRASPTELKQAFELTTTTIDNLLIMTKRNDCIR